MLKSFLIGCFFLMSATSFAAPAVDKNLYRITSVEVTEVDSHDLPMIAPQTDTIKSLDEIAMVIDGLIAIGKKVWPIIDANRPVINTASLAPAMSIIPETLTGTARAELSQMANWSSPKVVSYHVSYKNAYKIEVVGFTYSILFQYNGSHQGKGKYITGLKVQASEDKAAWGFNFDAASELLSMANVGTEENPVASGMFQVSYKVRGLINEMRNAQSFYVDGSGDIKVLNQ